MTDYEHAEIMHEKDWERLVSMSHSIENQGLMNEPVTIEGKFIVQLCQLVSNNGLGVYFDWPEDDEA